MAKKLYEESDIQNIANSIRNKNGLTDTYKVSDMADAIDNISGGSSTKSNIYKVNSIEEMNEISDMVEGDVCLISNESVGSLSEGDRLYSWTFNKTEIVIPSPITTTTNIYYYPEGSTSTYIRFNLRPTSIEIRIKDIVGTHYCKYYPNDDNSKYILNQAVNFNITFGDTFEFENGYLINGTWDDILSNIVDVIKTNFNGLYLYKDKWEEYNLNTTATKDYLLNGYKALTTKGYIVGEFGNMNSLMQIQKVNNILIDSINNTSSITSYSKCFQNTTINKIPVIEYLNFSGSNDFSYMFSGNKNIEYVDLSDKKIDTDGVSFQGMFSGCTSLKEIKFAYSNRELTNVYLHNFFNECTSLEKIDLKNLKGIVNNYMYLFNYCTNLKFVDMRNLDFSTNGTSYSAFNNVNQDNLKIIVKDQTEKNWWTSHNPSYANCFYTLEEAIAAGIVEE